MNDPFSPNTSQKRPFGAAPSGMNCDPETGRQFLSRRRKLLIPVVVGLLIFIGLSMTGPGRTGSGEVIDRPGVYCYPSGGDRVEIEETDAGTNTISIRRQTIHFRMWHTTSVESLFSFESSREWFVSVDRYRRLWIFCGTLPPDQSPVTTPSGGFVPKVQSVLMAGAFFVHAGGPHEGTSTVSSTGGWEGVPVKFFVRIPGKQAPVWGETPPIPTLPPPFQSWQRKKIRAHLNR